MHLAALYKRAITHYEEYQAESWLVPDSIPILYFVDLESYSRSALKIVTVGLNPSDAEFLEDRFRTHEIRLGCLGDLERSLSEYFKYNPYRKWFDRGFETLLQPIGHHITVTNMLGVPRCGGILGQIPHYTRTSARRSQHIPLGQNYNYNVT